MRCEEVGGRKERAQWKAAGLSRLGSDHHPADVLRPFHSDTMSILPVLPPETIEHIIKLSLPTDDRDRRHALLAYSLVDSTWRDIAQRELGRQVVLYGLPGTKKFAAALEEQPRLAETVRSLTPAPELSYEIRRMDDWSVALNIIVLCGSLKTLSIEYLWGVELMSISAPRASPCGLARRLLTAPRSSRRNSLPHPYQL